jgi:hypothetical protein
MIAPGRPRTGESVASNGEIAAHFLPVGLGIALGMMMLPGWGVVVIALAVGFAGAHIVLRSTEYRAYRSQFSSPGKGRAVLFFLVKTFTETIKIGVATLVGILLANVLR